MICNVSIIHACLHYNCLCDLCCTVIYTLLLSTYLRKWCINPINIIINILFFLHLIIIIIIINIIIIIIINIIIIIIINILLPIINIIIIIIIIIITIIMCVPGLGLNGMNPY